MEGRRKGGGEHEVRAVTKYKWEKSVACDVGNTETYTQAGPSLRTPRQYESSVFRPGNAELAGATPSGRCSGGENGAMGSSGET